MLVIDNKPHHEKMLARAKKSGSLESLQKQLDYLDNYGEDSGMVVHLGYDFAGYGVTWTRPQGDVLVPWMYGGLIHHSHVNEWSVHT